MKIIKSNPFRILGLVADSTEREIQKQVSILKRFAEIGKAKDTVYDFEFIGDFKRDIISINESEKNIEQAKQKIRFALFWFTEITNVDETCLAYLKENNISKAIEIWKKTLRESITESNYSSYQNLSTLYFIKSIESGFDFELFSKAISLKLIFLNSSLFKLFTNRITGNHISIDNVEICNIFVEEINNYYSSFLKNCNLISVKKYLSLFDNFPEKSKKSLKSMFIEKPISEIEKNIESTIELRKSELSKSNVYAEKLYKNSKSKLNELKAILNDNSLELTMILNKVANEILQCSIEYFNYYRENDFIDPGSEALRIAKLAVSLNPKGQVVARIEENLPVIKEWIESKPQREKFNKIKKQNTFILEKLDTLNNQRQITLNDVESFLNSCRPKLNEISSILGNNDEDYINISSIIALQSQDIVVQIFNNVQKNLMDSVNSFTPDYQKLNLLKQAYEVFEKCDDILADISQLELNNNARNKVSNNKEGISEATSTLYKLINPHSRSFTQPSTSSSSGSSQSSGGCYIATMAYGDFNHSQVLKLREFRDSVLLKKAIGRLFVKIYYILSPKLVKILEDKKGINGLIRNMLDNLIKELKL